VQEKTSDLCRAQTGETRPKHRAAKKKRLCGFALGGEKKKSIEGFVPSESKTGEENQTATSKLARPAKKKKKKRGSGRKGNPVSLGGRVPPRQSKRKKKRKKNGEAVDLAEGERVE